MPTGRLRYGCYSYRCYSYRSGGGGGGGSSSSGPTTMSTIPHQQSPLSMLHMLDNNQDVHLALRKPAISPVAAVERQRSRQSIPNNGVPNSALGLHLCGKYRPRRGPRLQKQDPDNGPSAIFCQRRKGRPSTPEADPGCPGKWFIGTSFTMAHIGHEGVLGSRSRFWMPWKMAHQGFFASAERVGHRLQKQILDALESGPSGLFCQRRKGPPSTPVEKFASALLCQADQPRR